MCDVRLINKKRKKFLLLVCVFIHILIRKIWKMQCFESGIEMKRSSRRKKKNKKKIDCLRRLGVKMKVINLLDGNAIIR